MRVLVSGADGQLGRSFRDVFAKETTFEVRYCTRTDFDLLNDDSVRSQLVDFQPNIVVNTAAYTNVELAESEVDLANQINGYAAGKLAEQCKQQGILLLHFSTDYVFDGTQSIAYQEHSPTNPLNAYGRSKRLGEELVLAANEQAVIIRVSWLFSEYGKNFLLTMRSLFQKEEVVKVVDDQVASPTYARVLAEDIVTWLKNDATLGGGGMLHYSHDGLSSWFDFATEIYRHMDAGCQLVSTTSSTFKSKAERPKFSKLDNEKFCRTTSLKMITWQEGVKRCMNNLV